MDTFLHWLAGNTIAATAATIAMSVLVVCITLIYLTAFIQGRRISFWPPSIGEKPAGRLRSKNSRADSDNEVAQLKKEISKKHAQLVYVRNLHKVKHKLGYWRLTYTIDDKGGVHTKEEMSILPLEPGQVCYFRQVVLGVSATVAAGITVQNLQAVNVLTKQQLEVIEINKDTRRHIYAVILDPPATTEKPTDITIESYRPEVFDPLIANLQDQGSIRIVGTSNAEVEIKFIAPPKLEFTSFSISPNPGLCEFENVGKLSCVTWRTRDLPDRTYAYVLQAKKRKP